MTSICEWVADDIVYHILTKLRTKDRLAVSLTCKKWRQLCLQSFQQEHDQLWIQWGYANNQSMYDIAKCMVQTVY